MSDQNDDISSSKSCASIYDALQQFKALYFEQLKKSDDTYDGLKTRVKVLQKWVQDLTDQNELLVKTVEELEIDALERLTLLEANISDAQKPETSLSTARDLLTAKGLDRVEGLFRELEEVKEQLSEKEQLVAKYQHRVEELRGCIEKGKVTEDEVCVNQHSITELCESNFNQEHQAHHPVEKEETLAEVLGIKERSLSHLEHLTEQLEQKEHAITCLKSQLQQYRETPNALYRVRQQVDWFTENIAQQCASGNVPEEFKKCITTMLEELRESIECCNLGPTSTGPCKVR
uniref:Uncharacterized protein n=1 Tax=Graphocephala atropunctata TaxID=36148 RepID=A0A1B6L1W6_9HEMI